MPLRSEIRTGPVVGAARAAFSAAGLRAAFAAHGAFARRARSARDGPAPRALQARRQPGGFTLLEVLVAVAVIATALVSLLALHGRNIQIVAYDQRLNRATLLAQDLMTRTIVAEDFPDPTRSSGDFPDDRDYHWELEVLRGPNREIEDEIREIRVRVYWDVDDPDAVRLATMVRKPEQ